MKILKITIVSLILTNAFTLSAQKYAFEKLCTPEVIQAGHNEFLEASKKDAAYTANRFLGYGVTREPTWKIYSKKPNKYKVRVFIIGESTNKSYMSAFGYPEKTTPFLDSIPGTFYDNFISCSANTVQTLTRTLLALNKEEAQQEHKPTWDSPNSVVTLANAAGYKTYFISNQDITGVYDAANTNIALKANYYTNEAQKSLVEGSERFEYFPAGKNKNEHNGAHRNDFNLLYKFRDALDYQPNEEKTIFLHIWGPHAEGSGTWSNLDVINAYDIPIPDLQTGYGPKADGYIKGVYTTDQFIKAVYDELESRNIDYSIIYTSDHGHDMDIDPENPMDPHQKTIHHNGMTQGGHTVPLVVINSDDTKKQRKEEYLSQYYFVDLFADWLGVKTNLTDDRFTLNNYPQIPIRVWNLTYGQKNYNDLFKSKILQKGVDIEKEN